VALHKTSTVSLYRGSPLGCGSEDDHRAFCSPSVDNPATDKFGKNS